MPGARDPGQGIGSHIGAIAGGVVAAIVTLGLVTVALAIFSYFFV